MDTVVASKELGTLILKKNNLSGPTVDDPEVVSVDEIRAGNITVRINVDSSAMESRGKGLSPIEHFVTDGYVNHENSSIYYSITATTSSNREF